MEAASSPARSYFGTAHLGRPPTSAPRNSSRSFRPLTSPQRLPSRSSSPTQPPAAVLPRSPSTSPDQDRTRLKPSAFLRPPRQSTSEPPRSRFQRRQPPVFLSPSLSPAPPL